MTFLDNAKASLFPYRLRWMAVYCVYIQGALGHIARTKEIYYVRSIVVVTKKSFCNIHEKKSEIHKRLNVCLSPIRIHVYARNTYVFT